MHKKITYRLICLLSVFLMMSGVHAASYDTSKIEAAYQKAVAFYKKQKTLTSFDEIITVESLGLEAESETFKLSSDVKQTLKNLNEDSTHGELSKGILSLALLGEDPGDYEGHDYIKLLENRVNAQGALKEEDAPNLSVYVLCALIAVNSSKAELVAKHIAGQALDNGAFWYEYGGKWADEATTSWVIEALTVLNKSSYSETLKKAIAYLASVEHEDASFDGSGWGGSAETQGAVLEALFVYDKASVLQGDYDIVTVTNKKQAEETSTPSQEEASSETVSENQTSEEATSETTEEESTEEAETGTTSPVTEPLLRMKDTELTVSVSPIDYLLGYQLEDGSFYASYTGAYNAYSTSSGARALGTYKNGSFLEDAKAEYEATQKGDEEPYVKPDGTIKAGQDATFKTNLEEADVTAVMIDGLKVDADDYEIKDGQLIISGDVTKSLSAGKHTLKVMTAEGEVTATLTIAGQSTKSSSSSSKKSSFSSKKNSSQVETGDQTHLTHYLVMALMAMLGIMLVLKVKKDETNA